MNTSCQLRAFRRALCAEGLLSHKEVASLRGLFALPLASTNTPTKLQGAKAASFMCRDTHGCAQQPFKSQAELTRRAHAIRGALPLGATTSPVAFNACHVSSISCLFRSTCITSAQDPPHAPATRSPSPTLIFVNREPAPLHSANCRPRRGSTHDTFHLSLLNSTLASLNGSRPGRK